MKESSTKRESRQNNRIKERTALKEHNERKTRRKKVNKNALTMEIQNNL